MNGIVSCIQELNQYAVHARDASTDNTRGMMVTMIQLKLSRSGGGVADKDEETDAE